MLRQFRDRYQVYFRHSISSSESNSNVTSPTNSDLPALNVFDQSDGSFPNIGNDINNENNEIDDTIPQQSLLSKCCACNCINHDRINIQCLFSSLSFGILIIVAIILMILKKSSAAMIITIIIFVVFVIYPILKFVASYIFRNEQTRNNFPRIYLFTRIFCPDFNLTRGIHNNNHNDNQEIIISNENINNHPIGRIIRDIDNIEMDNENPPSDDFLTGADRLRLLLTERDFNGNDYEMLSRLDVDNVQRPSEPTGLSESEINRMPTIIMSDNHNLNKLKCSICLDQFESGDLMRTVSCMHSFHADCIDPWLKKHPTCPICKFEVLTE